MLHIGSEMPQAELSASFMCHAIVPKCLQSGCVAACDWSYSRKGRCIILPYCQAHHLMTENENKSYFASACLHVRNFEAKVTYEDMLWQPVHRGYVYALQEHEFASRGQNVLKFGRTRNIAQRMLMYPKEIVIHEVLLLDEYKQFENCLLDDLKCKFIHRTDIGTEYFQATDNELGGLLQCLYDLATEWKQSVHTGNQSCQADELSVCQPSAQRISPWKTICKRRTDVRSRRQRKSGQMLHYYKVVRTRIVGFEVPYDQLEGDWIYLIRPRRFVQSGESVVKIGRTRRLPQRLCIYPKGSHVLWCQRVHDSEWIETHLKLHLQEQGYEQLEQYGSEYFHVNLAVIVPLVQQFCATMDRPPSPIISVEHL